LRYTKAPACGATPIKKNRNVVDIVVALPETFLSRIKKQLNAEDFSAFFASYKNPPLRGLRLNPLKISNSSFFERGVWGENFFPQKKFPPPRSVSWCPTGFIYDNELRPAKTIAYHAGLFYIQEPSAMCPAEMLSAQPGDFVLDICAAPGGKSVQIAGHLQGRGVLVASDASASRSRALVKNLENSGVTNAIVLTEQPQKLAGKFEAFFDKILVDAPCSGEGMFRRDSDLVRAYTANKPDACAAVQREILRYAAMMLKPGGRLVYSTCTFNTIENEEQIAAFLENHSDFSLLEKKRIWPHLDEGEGHFVALLEKNLGGEPFEKGSPPNPLSKKTLTLEFEKFCEDFLNISFAEKTLVLHNHNLYAQSVPINLKGLRTARSGWFLGEVKKDRFVPSQALAMGIRKEDARHAIELSTPDAEKYLRGESLWLEDAENFPPTKPWVLMCHKNFPLGWARLVQGRLKNQLPTGWTI